MSGKIRYRSLTGDVYEAEAHNPIPGCCGYVVAIFPSGARFEMTAIPFVGTDNGARGVCFEIPAGQPDAAPQAIQDRAKRGRARQP